MMSEQSIQLRSQAPNISFCDTSVVPHGLSQAEKHVKHKPRFVEFACSHHEVSFCVQFGREQECNSDAMRCRCTVLSPW